MFREVLAVLLLTVGSIVPVIPWVVGVARLWTSSRWRLPERLLGTMVWPLGYVTVLAVAALVPPAAGGGCVTVSATTDGGSATCRLAIYTYSGPVAWLLAGVGAVLVAAPLVVGAVLLVLARRRERAETPA